VGNGPSLNDTPLGLLEGEVSYGVNAVHLIYQQTSWRPTDLVIGDLDRDHMAWIHDLRSKPWFVDERTDRFFSIIDANADAQIHIRGAYQKWAERLLGERDNVSYFDVCTHHSRGITNTIADKAPKSWHFPQICRWGGTITMAIQLAMQIYKPLYIIGCDLDYKPGADNHFIGDYYEAIDADKAYNLNAVIANAHSLANSQWEIYNAGVGGTLDAYEKVNLKELF